MTQDSRVSARSNELVREAAFTIKAISSLASGKVEDPLTDPATLAQAVKSGLLDAPQLKNNPYGRGQIIARIDKRGACIAVDPQTGDPMREQVRIALLNNQDIS